MAELLTARQKERRLRDVAVAAKFKEMQRQYPKASRTLIIDEMVRLGGVDDVKSPSGIRSALIRTGAITV